MPKNADSELVKVDQLLDRWGTWAREHAGARLRLPRRTVIGRCMEEGPAASQPTGPEGSAEPLVEAIERVVINAPPRIRAVLITNFCTHRHLPVEVRARKLHTSRSGLYTEISIARAYALGALAG